MDAAGSERGISVISRYLILFSIVRPVIAGFSPNRGTRERAHLLGHLPAPGITPARSNLDGLLYRSHNEKKVHCLHNLDRAFRTW